MAVTLSGELLTAMNSMTRHPRVSITGDSYEPDLPMDGMYTNTMASGEHRPSVFLHSTGRFIGTTTVEGQWADYGQPRTIDERYMHLFYSDIERKYITQLPVFDVMENANPANPYKWEIWGQSICELEDGNIGCTFVKRYYGHYINEKIAISSIVYKGWSEEIYDPREPGLIITGEVVIQEWSNPSEDDYWVDSPYLCRGSGESTYYCTYVVQDMHADNDSGEYKVFQRTTTDFTTWTAPVEMTLPFSGEISWHKRNNPFIIQPETGQNFCFFMDYIDDYTPDFQSYFSNTYKFENDGSDLSVWGSGEKVTLWDQYGFGAEHPTAVMTSGERMYLGYHDIRRVIYMDSHTPDWCVGTPDPPAYSIDIHNAGYMTGSISFNTHSRRLLCLNNERITERPISAYVVDVDEWEITDCYSCTSTPGWDLKFNDENSWGESRKSLNAPNSGWLGFGTCGGSPSNPRMSFAIDTETDQIYEFELGVNVFYDFGPKDVFTKLRGTFMAYPYFYHLFTFGNAWETIWTILSIDLREANTPSFTLAGHRYTGPVLDWNEEMRTAKIVSFIVHPECNLATVCSQGSGLYVGQAGMGIVVLPLGYGSDVEMTLNTESMPETGCAYPAFYNGSFYCGTYNGLYRLGLDGTDEMIYPDCDNEASWPLEYCLSTGDGKIVSTTSDQGIYLFNTVDDYNPFTTAWVVYNNDTLPGFTPEGLGTLGEATLAYDEMFHVLFVSRGPRVNADSSHQGIMSFSIHGTFKQMEYHTLTWSGSEWGFDAKNHMTLYFFDYNGVILDDPVEHYIWSFWVRGDINAGAVEESIKWDKADNFIDFAEFLTGPVEATWSIGEPNEMNFTLAEGALWDPHNLRSLYSIHTQRGRKMTLRFGEDVDGTTHWSPQGDYIVEELQVNYTRPIQPTAQITCRDIRSQWYEGEVQLTNDYSGEYPEVVLADLLEDHCFLVSGENYALPSSGEMSFSHPIYMRWMEQNIMEIIDELLDHFRYTHIYDSEGNFSIRELDYNKEVDHYYNDVSQIKTYSPNNDYSIYTNRVVVKGEGRYDLPVVYGREMLAQNWGTTGWWGATQGKWHWYDKDKKLSVLNPRLKITQAPSSNSLFGGGGSIRQTATSDKFMVVEVTAPDRIAELVGAVFMMTTAAACALFCDKLSWIPVFGGSMCGICITFLSMGSIAASDVLGTIGQFSYEIYGQPKGTVKQTFQAEANDFEAQMLLDGMIITEEINDPLCYEQAHAKFVAERSMELIKWQRYGGRLTKIADLRDELLDVISVPHPHSLQPFKYLIYSLTRRFVKPDTSAGGEGDGEFVDEIDGWNLSIIKTDVSLDP